MRKKIIIMGAAGRDFHNFNLYYREDPNVEVVAFTASQIPNISRRTYPPSLAGNFYPEGIPIYLEEKLEKLIRENGVEEVVLAYSDLSYKEVMHKASRVIACGANFKLLGPKATMISSKKPTIAICATRTGAGKSPTTRKVVDLCKRNFRVVVIRHPMPYGDLEKMGCQRFKVFEDLRNCSIEEREEYEPLLKRNVTVYSGLDQEKILKKAEKEADLIIFDGGNNDLPFIKPDLHLVVTDCLRSGHEIFYYPGEVNLLMADILILSKVNVAKKEDVKLVEENVKKANPNAQIIKAELDISLEGKEEEIYEKKVLVVEDGPTLTHGGMNFGAGFVLAKKLECKIIDASLYAKNSLKEVYKKYPHLNKVLPAMGYSKKQIKDLEKTIRSVPAEALIIATPCNLKQLIKIEKPTFKVSYELKSKSLEKLLLDFLEKVSR